MIAFSPLLNRPGHTSAGFCFWGGRVCLTFLLLLYGSLSHAALTLQLAAADLAPEEQTQTHQLLAKAALALPPRLVAGLDQVLRVHWSAQLPSDVIGRASTRGTVTLNRRWLPALIGSNDPVLPQQVQHGDIHTGLVATLLHEIAHHYDRAQLWPRDQRILLQRCHRQEQVQGLIGLPPECRGQTGRRFTLSDDPRFLDLAGWPEQVGGRGRRDTQNHRELRSPDLYELHSPQEFLAVNFEYFLLDPFYACRRPALYQYFREHFGWAPARASDCSVTLPYVNADLSQNASAVGWLDPSRIYQVHYLLAEPDEAWASRWGHSMLRLVICAPGRPLGPDCLLDLDQHLVLSFRAFVDDLQLSSWKGLTGVYPSRLFILPFNKVVDEYTQLELRGISSVPLNLTVAQRRQLATEAATLHWSYDGTYYFVSNNCAVETLKLLRSGSQHPQLRDLESLTPIGLLQLLEARGLADTAPLQDRSKAMRMGYYFDSHRERYQRMFEVVREQLAVPEGGFEQWLASPAAQRSAWLDQGDLRTTAALLVLEQAARRRQVQLIQQELKQRFMSQSKAPANDLTKSAELMQQLLAGSSFLSRPGELIQAGYGLPQPSDADLASVITNQQQQLLRATTTLDEQLLLLLTQQQQDELQHTDENLNTLSEHLHRQHEAAGGLILP